VWAVRWGGEPFDYGEFSLRPVCGSLFASLPVEVEWFFSAISSGVKPMF